MWKKLLLLIILLPVFLIGISCDAQIDVPSKQFSVLWEKDLITHSEFYMSNRTYSSFPLLNKSLIIFPEVVNYDYMLSAYDATSGNLEWQTPIISFRNFNYASGKILLYGASPYMHELVMIDADNGNLLWKSSLRNYFGNDSTYYAIFPEQIFVSTLRENLYSMDMEKLSRMVALDKSNGNVLYALDFEPETEFVFGEIDEKQAYILLDHSIKIINTQTGDMLEEIYFQIPLDIVDIKFHFVENNLLYVINQKNSFFSDINPYIIQVLDLSNGMIRSSNEIIKTPQDVQLARKIRLSLGRGATHRILHKDSSLLVFYIFNDSSIYALNRDTGLMEWERNFLDPSFRKNYEVYYTNTNQPIYIVLDQERLYALNLLDNQILWEKDISSEQVENITLFDGMLIHSDPLNEDIICHDIETGDKLWKIKAELLHPLRSQIAVNSDAIYFIGEDWTFYALMKP